MSPDLDPYPGDLVARTLRSVIRWIRTLSKSLDGEPKRLHKIPEAQDKTPTTRETANAAGTPTDPILKKIFAGASRFPGLSIYIHGSWADNTRTTFSDLDDLIVVDSKYFRDKKVRSDMIRWLNAVDMRFCRLDPLQHHGHWLLEREELSQLNESNIPLLVVDQSLCLQGPFEVGAHVDTNRTREGLLENIRATLQNIEAWHYKYEEDRLNLYEAKCLVGSFLLLPAYLFQLRGIRVSKRYGIEHAHEILSIESLKAIHWASNARTRWDDALAGYKFQAFSYLPYLFTNPHLYRRVAQTLAPRFPKKSLPLLGERAVKSFVAQCNQQAIEHE